MKYTIGIMSLLLFVATPTFSAKPASMSDYQGRIPKTILIKQDANGEIYVYKSNNQLGKIKAGQEAGLDKIKFERLSDIFNQVKIRKNLSETAELDSDTPRQSWYRSYWNHGYYPYYPIYYYAYNMNFSYYPYYNYNWNGCNYYWYGSAQNYYY